MREELSRLMAKEKQLEGKLLTLTGVSLAPDFKQATVFFSTLDNRARPEELEAKLNELGHGWHRDLGKRIRLKYTPRLVFEFDQSVARGDRVLELLNEIETKSPPGEPNS